MVWRKGISFNAYSKKIKTLPVFILGIGSPKPLLQVEFVP